MMHLHQRRLTGHGTRKEPDGGDDSAVTRGVSAGSHSTQAEVGRGGLSFSCRRDDRLRGKTSSATSLSGQNISTVGHDLWRKAAQLTPQRWFTVMSHRRRGDLEVGRPLWFSSETTEAWANFSKCQPVLEWGSKPPKQMHGLTTDILVDDGSIVNKIRFIGVLVYISSGWSLGARQADDLLMGKSDLSGDLTSQWPYRPPLAAQEAALPPSNTKHHRCVKCWRDVAPADASVSKACCRGRLVL